ncbi:MAG: ribosome maturation factor RimM [Candidatus Hydrogenedentota bacterium]
MAEEHVYSGKVVSTRPDRREVRIDSVPGMEARIEAEGWVWFRESTGREWKCKVIGVRHTGQGPVITISAGTPKDTIAKLRGADVLASALPGDEAEPMYTLEDLHGLAVAHADGTIAGHVTDLYEGKAHAMAAVETPAGGEMIIPLIPEVVESVDLEAGLITVGDLTPYSVSDED